METREILETSIKEHQAAIDRATQELAALDKPELRHGDYEIAEDGNCIWLKDEAGVLRPFTELGMLSHLTPEKCNKGIKLGNIFDDLERNSKDLDGFEMFTHHGGKLKVEIDCTNDVVFSIPRTPRASTDIKEAVEIHQKLGRLIATAIRRETE